MVELLVFLTAAAGTFLIRGVAVSLKLIDVPNARSSHAQPTPRGGGIALMAAFLLGITVLWLTGELELRRYLALCSVVPVTLIGILDDRHSLSARVRFGVQLLSAAAALLFLGGVEQIAVGPFELQGAWLNALALLGVLWMTNLYNFLDGIDGYAAAEALFAGAAASLLFGNGVGMIVAAAAAGFLLFNWHRATIFMGDAGSASLGFVFAVLALSDAASHHFLGWMVLLSLFWFDATVTLLRRFRRGERLTSAHRKHAYQRLHRSGVAHDKVVLMGMGVNLLFALLLALVTPDAYWAVLLAAIAVLSIVMVLIDRRKAFG